MARATYQAPGYANTEIAVRLMAGMGWTTSATYVARCNHAINAVAHAACTWEGTDWWWLHDVAEFQTHEKTIDTVANGGAQRTSDVTTLKLGAAHGIAAGQTVKVSDCSDSTFDGTFIVTSVTATEILFYNSGSNVGAATAGTGSVNVVSYPFHTIDINGAITTTDASKVAQSIRTVQRIYYDDDWPLQEISWADYRRKERILQTTNASKPLCYAIRSRALAGATGDDPSGSAPYIYLWPAPDDAYDIYVDYIKRHSDIDLTATTGTEDYYLIIPTEYQEGIYIDGALWLLQRDTSDHASLRDCPGFMEAITRMYSSPLQNPKSDNLYDDAKGTLPHNRRIMGNLIQNDVSIP